MNIRGIKIDTTDWGTWTWWWSLTVWKWQGDLRKIWCAWGMNISGRAWSLVYEWFLYNMVLMSVMWTWRGWLSEYWTRRWSSTLWCIGTTYISTSMFKCCNIFILIRLKHKIVNFVLYNQFRPYYLSYYHQWNLCWDAKHLCHMFLWGAMHFPLAALFWNHILERKNSMERIFNYRLCRARRVVENVFGMLRAPMLLGPEITASISPPMSCETLPLVEGPVCWVVHIR